MSKILSADVKIRLIKKAKKGGNVSKICKKVQVSRAIFYKWLKTYENAGRRAKKKALAPKYLSGNKHWKKLNNKVEKKILKIAIKTPSLSPQKIAKIVGISKSGVFGVLKKNNLNTRRLREDYIYRNTKSLVKEKSISYKVTMVRRHEAGDRVADICRDFDVSRTIFYRWLKRYSAKKNYGEEVQREALLSLRPKGEKHWRYVPEAKDLVLRVVLEHPEFSVHKISKALFQKENKHILSSYGVHTLLKRLDLNTYQRRVAYAKAQEAIIAPIPQAQESWKAPIFGQIPSVSALAPPSGFFNKLISSKFFLPLLSVVLVSFGFSVVLSNLSYGQGIVGKVGILFSFVALFFGMFFFVYSLKYYLTIAIVLSFSRNKKDKSDMGNKAVGLKSDISSVHLERHPFVSIHIASYNEKRVVERLLKAATSQDYDNYEVVIADDSTDETAQIIENYLRVQSSKLKVQSDEGYTLISCEIRSGLALKHLHRSSREGFKGGALKGALEHTDKRAEYILIFDADFIPYPDTIVQFLKYFQATTGTLDITNSNIEYLNSKQYQNTNDQNSKQFRASDFGFRASSRVAAVQGYQWHVLNKSENWITRGVRSEYSGSYVIERSGEEIYSGLKQISGSVYMIRRSVLESIGWGTSITEDFELTLKLYEKGYKVVYTPYIQAPAEGVSTIKRLIRQRMRWAEGHSHNIRKMFMRLMFGHWVLDRPQGVNQDFESRIKNQESSKEGNHDSYFMIHDSKTKKVWQPSPLTIPEKLEFLYLSPYYLQAAFFIFGTLSWFLAEVIFKVRLPFWTEIWGWSLVFTNLLALPLLNMVGLFLEESDEKDYLGIFSFIVLSYIVAPFQGYAAIKGFLAKEEGPWFRTPKTGRITDNFVPGRLYRFVRGIFGRPAATPSTSLRTFGLSTTNNTLITTNLAFVSAHNSFSNFRIRRKTVRWVGNTTLALFLIATIFLTSFSRFIPITSKASAASRNFKSLKQTKDMKIPAPPQHNEITGPEIVRYQLQDDKALEYIFHPDPRIRTKYDKKEIEIILINSEGLGYAKPKKSIKEDGKYTYQEVFDRVDARYIPKKGELVEELVLKEYRDFNSINYSIKTIDLLPRLENNEVHFSGSHRKDQMITFTAPFMYEEGNQEEKSFEIRYELEKKQFGWTLKKALTEEGRKWLADPTRQFPVVIDPTAVNSVIQATVTDAETNFGHPMRRIAYFPNATDGAAWYVVHGDGGLIVVEKCKATDLCDGGGDWTVVTSDLDQGTGSDNDTDNLFPTVWKEGNTMYVTWFDNDRDTYQFNSINTASSDALSGTVCNGADIGTLSQSLSSIAVADDGDVYIAQAEIPGGDTARVSRIATGACTELDITANSGFDTNDRAEILTIGNNAFLIFVADNGLRASVYVDDGTPAWDTQDADVNGATADNTLINPSAVTDGTDIWIMQPLDTTGGTESFKCSACPTTSQTWTDIAEPWGSGLTATDPLGLSYLSTPNQLVAMVVDDGYNSASCTTAGTSDCVLSKSTDADTISWGSQFSFAGGGVTELSNVGMTANVASDDQLALTFRDETGSELEFATLPEFSLILLILMPILPRLLKKLRNRRLKSRL